MNTANKLTILRVVMIPAFLLVLYLDVPGANYWALAIFAAASITDDRSSARIFLFLRFV